MHHHTLFSLSCIMMRNWSAWRSYGLSLGTAATAVTAVTAATAVAEGDSASAGSAGSTDIKIKMGFKIILFVWIETLRILHYLFSLVSVVKFKRESVRLRDYSKFFFQMFFFSNSHQKQGNAARRHRRIKGQWTTNSVLGRDTRYLEKTQRKLRRNKCHESPSSFSQCFSHLTLTLAIKSHSTHWIYSSTQIFLTLSFIIHFMNAGIDLLVECNGGVGRWSGQAMFIIEVIGIYVFYLLYGIFLEKLYTHTQPFFFFHFLMGIFF